MQKDSEQGAAAPIEARHWIDGEWLRSARTGDSVDPATGRIIGRYHDGGAEEAELAIAAAARAFEDDSWTADPQRRAVALMRLADAYEARREEVVATLCRENGKLRHEAGFEAGLILRGLRFAAGLALQNFGRVMDPRPGFQGMSIVQPIGVAGLIIPWNSPAYLSIRALAPALAAGCTAAIKMPMQAAQTAALMSEILASVPDLPRGAVNLFIESGAAGAKRLVDSPLVKTVSFTGSTGTGRAIARSRWPPPRSSSGSASSWAGRRRTWCSTMPISMRCCRCWRSPRRCSPGSSACAAAGSWFSAASPSACARGWRRGCARSGRARPPIPPATWGP
ncbi:Gamma-aminobutyraldehyde dehydrogenase [Burkholderia gladioli]